MLIEEKQTFKDFLESDEAIATNILSSRLKMLGEFKILTKGKRPDNKKINIYHLTEKGIALAPVIVELALWSDANMRDFHPQIIETKHIDVLKKSKEKFVVNLQNKYRANLATTPT